MEKNKKDYIKSLSMFKNFSDEAISELTGNAVEKKCQQGNDIFREGDPAGDIFILVEGDVQIIKKISPEQEKILSVIGSGSVFGEMGIFSDMARTASARSPASS